jgi:hypothetical protein
MLPPIAGLQAPLHNFASPTIKQLKRATENGRAVRGTRKKGEEIDRRGKSRRFMKLITDCF